MINIYLCLFATFHHPFVITSENVQAKKMMNTYKIIVAHNEASSTQIKRGITL